MGVPLITDRHAKNEAGIACQVVVSGTRPALRRRCGAGREGWIGAML